MNAVPSVAHPDWAFSSMVVSPSIAQERQALVALVPFRLPTHEHDGLQQSQ